MMGLDMWLFAENFFMSASGERIKIDGFPKSSERLEVAYWRKYADLHGFIVQEFADGEDNCEPIWLDAERLQTIIDAVKRGNLPHTEGFFFRWERGDEELKALQKYTVDQLQAAIDWLSEDKDGVIKSIEYEASW